MIAEDPELEHVIRLLRRDVLATVGPDHDREVRRLAAMVLEYRDSADAADKIVEDVQQYLLDTFVDTTWPACFRHPNHPMWFRPDGWWWCEQDEVPLVRLGQLPARHRERNKDS